METPERLLSDEEVENVIARATELDARSGEVPAVRESSGGALSLRTVREIAEEIGIAPGLVDQAAAEVLDRPSDRLARLAGGPLRERLHSSFPRRLSQEEVRALVDRLRGVARQQGSVKDVLGAVEWRVGGASSMAVTVTPENDGTDVQVIGDRSGLAQGMFVVPLVAGLALGAIVVDQVHPDLPGMLGLLGSGVALGAGVAWVMWAVTARDFRRRLQAVQAEVRQFMRTRGPADDRVLGPDGSDG